VLTYVDDCIIVADLMVRIQQLITSLHDGTENFILQDKGSIDKSLGVNIEQLNNSSFHLTQPFLIERISAFLGIDNSCRNEQDTPVGKPLLNKDLNGVPCKYTWEYCGAIGMLTYLTGSVCLDIAMAVHQCAHFSTNPMRSHEQAVMRIGQYLLFSKDKGMVYAPDPTRGLEVWVDAEFADSWDPSEADSADNVYFLTGFVIYYAGCPVFWQSKLQTKIALSTAEAKYISMLQEALRETIPLATLMCEMNEIFPLYLPSTKFIIRCKKTISLTLLWLKIQSLLLGPCTLSLNTIIFGSMLSRKQTQMGLFKLNFAPQMIKLQTLLLSLIRMKFFSSLGNIY
jgi:hypothetical protein